MCSIYYFRITDSRKNEWLYCVIGVLKVISKPKRYLKVRDKLVGSLSFDISQLEVDQKLQNGKWLILGS